MDFNQLPPELILCIGDFLKREPLNNLIRTSKRQANLLTSLFYHKAFRRHFRPEHDQEPEPRARSIWVYSRGRSYVSQRRLWACAPNWSSEYVMAYFQSRTLEWGKTRFGGRERNGATWLHLLAATGHQPLLRMFLEKGLDVNSRDWAGNTVLHAAAGKGELESVEVLIAAGADVMAVNDAKESVLVYALLRRRAQVGIVLSDKVKALGGDINANTDSQGIPPIFLAISDPIHGLEAVEHFLDLGVDVFQKREGTNDTLLHVAARCYNQPVGEYLIQQMRSRPEYFSLLNNSHNSPLHIAISLRQWSLSKALIIAGSNLSILDDEDRNALKLMLDHHGYDLLEPIISRTSPSSYNAACQTVQAWFWTLLNGKSYATTVKMLAASRTANIKLKLPGLHHLLENHKPEKTQGVPDLVAAISGFGANFNAQKKGTGELPLHVIIRDSVNYRLDAEALDKYVGYFIESTDERGMCMTTVKGETVLHYAARWGTVGVMEMLLKKVGKGLFDRYSKEGKTALQEAVARKGNNKKLVKMLLDRRERFRTEGLRKEIELRSPRSPSSRKETQIGSPCPKRTGAKENEMGSPSKIKGKEELGEGKSSPVRGKGREIKKRVTQRLSF